MGKKLIFESYEDGPECTLSRVDVVDVNWPLPGCEMVTSRILST